MKTKTYITAGVCVLLAGLVLGLLAFIGLATMNRLDARDRLSQHDKLWHFAETSTPIIAWLEAEHVRTGTYPTTLPPRFSAILNKIAPEPCYSTSLSNAVFYLGFGDYAEDGFVYYWSSDRNEWMWDG